MIITISNITIIHVVMLVVAVVAFINVTIVAFLKKNGGYVN